MDLCRWCFRKSQSSDMHRQLMSQMLCKTPCSQPCYSQGNNKDINHNLVLHLLHHVMANFYKSKESTHLQRAWLWAIVFEATVLGFFKIKEITILYWWKNKKSRRLDRTKATAPARHREQLSKADRARDVHSPCRLCLLAFRWLVEDTA